MQTATRDLIVGTPRMVGEPVTDLDGNVPGWVFAVHASNLPDTDPALVIAQSTDPRGYLRDLRKDKRSDLGNRLRHLEGVGVTVNIRLLHEIIMKPGARYSPELKQYRKMWAAACDQALRGAVTTVEPTTRP